MESTIVSYSELSTFRDCPLKHFLAYRRRYTKPVAEMSPLDKGSNWHSIMEDHFKVIRDFARVFGGRIPINQEAQALQEALQAVAWRFLPEDGSEQTEMQELMEWMYRGYVAKWGANREWKILGVEQHAELPLPGEPGDPVTFLFKAKIDLIVFDWESGTRRVIDHKSCSDLPTQMALELDDQFGLYCWLMRQLGKPVDGAIHMAARTTRNKGDYPDCTNKNARAQTLEQRFAKSYVNHPDKELDNIAIDAYNAARAAYPFPGERTARYSSPDPRQCGWKCDFKDPHLAARRGRDIDKVMAEFGYVVNTTRH